MAAGSTADREGLTAASPEAAIGVLLLFDIDGTLLQGASRDHAAALHRALEDVYGVRGTSAVNVEAAGRTDLEIARAILLSLGVSARRIDEGLDELREACWEHYARTCPPSLAEHLVAGIDVLLADLAGRADVLLSLVTGNLEPIARLKLARAGIGRHFPTGMGGFGSDSEDRAALPAIARRRAARHTHAANPHPRSRTLVIGDTPRDIACARADGVGCIAVCTGPYGADALVGADAVARDVRELSALLLQQLAAVRV